MEKALLFSRMQLPILRDPIFSFVAKYSWHYPPYCCSKNGSGSPVALWVISVNGDVTHWR